MRRGFIGGGGLAVVLGVALAAQMKAEEQRRYNDAAEKPEELPEPTPSIEEPAMTRQQRRALTKPWKNRRK